MEKRVDGVLFYVRYISGIGMRKTLRPSFLIPSSENDLEPQGIQKPKNGFPKDGFLEIPFLITHKEVRQK